MATTTNFNWPTPNDTDLVKDGASAIRSLGSSIDTSFVDLKGGTTGQVLSKATNADLDFTWVAQDDSNAIQNAIVDAKGDLIAATGADTPARLAVGTNGQVLSADSTASTGLAWTTISSGGLTLLSTTTLSGTATTINSISQSYKDLLINIYGMTSSSSTQDVWAGMNGYGGFSQAAWGSGTSNTSGTKTSEQQWVTDGSTYFSSGSWFIYIPNYASTANTKIAAFNGFYGTQTCISGTFTSNSTSAVSSIYLKCPQTFSAGTVKIWGIN